MIVAIDYKPEHRFLLESKHTIVSVVAALEQRLFLPNPYVIVVSFHFL